MQIKYVGAKPIVSRQGVSFDQTKQDAYTFIAPAIELLEAMESIKSDDKGVVNLMAWQPRDLNEREMEDHLKKYCSDLDTMASEREKQTNALIDDLKEKVRKNSRISEDGRKAWLGNIALMRDYYLQYIANELAYNCLLHHLADTLVEKHIRIILFPFYRNYGLVFSHSVQVLTDHRPAIDASMAFEEKDDKTYGKFDLNIPLPST